MSIWNEEQRAAAMTSARKWQGTPHRNRMAKPGVGIDCLYFVREVATDAGILPTFTMPYYRATWGIGREFNVIERVLLTCCQGERIDPAAPFEFGDVVVFSVGRQSNHVGIVLDGEVWHCQADATVQPEPITDELRARLQSVLRLTAADFRRNPETITPDELAP